MSEFVIDKAAVGRRIRRLRRHRGLTQYKLAEMIPCSESAMSFYERGRYLPRRRRLMRIAHVLKCDLEWLEGRDGSVSPIPDSEAVALGNAAHQKAKEERLHCPGFVETDGVRAQCQMWAYHDGRCDADVPAGDPRSAFPPDPRR